MALEHSAYLSLEILNILGCYKGAVIYIYQGDMDVVMLPESLFSEYY